MYLDGNLKIDTTHNQSTETKTQHIIAVLDIGSNSFHFIIADHRTSTPTILHKAKYKVGLAQGLVNTGLINPSAFELGLDTLKKINTVLNQYQVDQVKVIATQALRSAKNTNEFIEQAAAVFPYPIEVIQGVEEARLIFKGVVSQNHSSLTQLVIDIGGGSSEFVIGKQNQGILLNSLNMGCVNFTNKFFHDGQLNQSNFDRAILAATEELNAIKTQYNQHGWQSCIGTSGSIESILSVIKLTNIGQEITLHNLDTLMSQTLELDTIDALNLGAVNEERKHVFPAGLAILIAIFRSLEITSMAFSSADLGQGVAFEIAEQSRLS